MQVAVVAVTVVTWLSRAMAQPNPMQTPTSRTQIGTSSFLTSIIPSDSTQKSEPGSEPVTPSEASAVAEPQSATESRQTISTTEVFGLARVDSDVVLSTSTVASFVVTLAENTILHSHTLTNISPQSNTEGLPPSLARSQDMTSLHHETTSSGTQVGVHVPAHGEDPPPASISSTSVGGIIPSRTMTTTRRLGGGPSSESMEEPSVTSTAPAPALALTPTLISDSVSETSEPPPSISETVTSGFAEITGTRDPMTTSARVADQSQDDWRIVVSDSHSLPPQSISDETAIGDIHVIMTTDNAEKKTESLSDEDTKTGIQENPMVAPNAPTLALVASAALPTMEAATETRAPVQSKLGFPSAEPGDVAQSFGLSQVDIGWTVTASWNDRTLSTSHHADGTTEHGKTTMNHEESFRGTATSTHRPAPLPSSPAIPATTLHGMASTHWLSDTTTWPPSGNPSAFLAVAEYRPTPADVSTPGPLSGVPGQNKSPFPTIVQEMQPVAQETGAHSSEPNAPVIEDQNPDGTLTQLTSAAPDDLSRPLTVGGPLTVTKWASIITDPEPKASVGPMPDDIPKVLLPAKTRSTDTKGMALIQIGFLEPLNYNFVASNMAAAAQIFALLPDALALSHRKEARGEVIDLRPRKTSGYISTMARLSYPEDMLDDLRLNIGTPNSELHTARNETLRHLAALIDAGFGAQLNDRAADGDCDSCRGSGSNQGSRLSTMKKVVVATSSVGGCFVICGIAFIVLRGRRRQRHTHYYLEKRVPRYEISQPLDSWNSVGL